MLVVVATVSAAERGCGRIAPSETMIPAAVLPRFGLDCGSPSSSRHRDRLAAPRDTTAMNQAIRRESELTMTNRRLFCIVLLALVAVPATAAWPRSLQQVLNTGTLRVGTALFAPWAARAPAGELVGFEVDVAKQLAADMGVKAEVLPYEFDRLIPALEAGEIDLIAAGLIITPQRALHVNFSAPYAESGVSLVTHSGRTAQVRALNDLDAPEFTLAVVSGSAAPELVRRILPRAEVEIFESTDAASAALLAGNVDAYLEDEPIPTFLALENPSTVDLPLDEPLLRSRAAFAIAKGDPDFLAFLNAWIEAREADTWLPSTIDYWFKSLRWRQRLERAASR